MIIVAKKALGQNFLINNEILENIVDLIPADVENIVEIGPGTGNLTRAILNIYDKIPLLAIEKDLQFQSKLIKMQQNNDNFEYIFNDVLQVEWSKYINIGKNSLIIGNLPYNIATKILFNIFEKSDFQYLIFMFQKEVAEKIAGIKSSHIGKISILTKLFSITKLEFLVTNENFSPKPKIDSAIVSFQSKKNILNKDQYKKLINILNIFFRQRRKKMGSIAKNLPKTIDVDIFKKIQIDPNDRPENITLNQWIALIQYL